MKTHISNVARAEDKTGGKAVWIGDAGAKTRKGAHPSGQLVIQMPELPPPPDLPPTIAFGSPLRMPSPPAQDPDDVLRGIVSGVPLPQPRPIDLTTVGDIISVDEAALATEDPDPDSDPDDPDPEPETGTGMGKWVGPIVTGALLLFLAWALTQEREYSYSRV